MPRPSREAAPKAPGLSSDAYGGLAPSAAGCVGGGFGIGVTVSGTTGSLPAAHLTSRPNVAGVSFRVIPAPGEWRDVDGPERAALARSREHDAAVLLEGVARRMCQWKLASEGKLRGTGKRRRS
jgi:hypothetical protein